MTPAQRVAYLQKSIARCSQQIAAAEREAAHFSSRWHSCRAELSKLRGTPAAQHPDGYAAHASQVAGATAQLRSVKRRSDLAAQRAADLTGLHGRLCSECSAQMGGAHAQSVAIEAAQVHNVAAPLPVYGAMVDGAAVDCADLVEELEDRVRSKTRKNTALTLFALLASGYWLTQTTSGKNAAKSVFSWAKHRISGER